MLTWQGTLASLLNFFWSTAGGLRCPALPSRATRGKIILGGIQNLVGGRAGGGVCFSFLTWGKERERDFGSSREWFKAAALRQKRASNLVRRAERLCESGHRPVRQVCISTRPRAGGSAGGHSQGRSPGVTAGWRRAGDSVNSYSTEKASLQGAFDSGAIHPKVTGS